MRRATLDRVAGAYAAWQSRGLGTVTPAGTISAAPAAMEVPLTGPVIKLGAAMDHDHSGMTDDEALAAALEATAVPNARSRAFASLAAKSPAAASPAPLTVSLAGRPDAR
jgi:hypothetical protein